jgi:hypothetical protein
MNARITRRAMLQQLSLAAGAGCFAAAPSRFASAAAATTPPHLDVHDPAAVAVGYVEEASDVKQNPKFVAGSNCENCLLLQGKPGDSWRPCTLFPGKLVKISGWCSSWTAEM